MQQKTSSSETNFGGMYQRRIGRLGFFLGFFYIFLAYVIAFLVYIFLSFLVSSNDDTTPERILNITYYLLGVLLILALYPTVFSLYIRRLHDINQSGFWSLLILFPPLGFALYIYLQVAGAINENNDYGPERHDNSPLVVLGMKKPTH